MDKKLVSGLVRDFSKQEVLEIAEEVLEEEVSSKISKLNIVGQVLDDIDDRGIPDLDECSDLVYEFLVAAEYVEGDDTDDVPEGGDEEKEELETEEEEGESGVEDDDLPECYGFADNRDPACKKCRIKSDCMKVRLASRPECYGLLYEDNVGECDICIEALSCKKEME